MRRSTPILCALALLLGGCLLNNLNPTQKLGERVQEYTDATRWARLDLAVQMVDPSYRNEFTRTHAAWGRSVEVADADVVHIQLAADGLTATSTLAYGWYDLSAMTLAHTVIRQTWDVRDGYRVIGEEFVEGDPGLLALPPTGSDTPAAADADDELASLD